MNLICILTRLLKNKFGISKKQPHVRRIECHQTHQNRHHRYRLPINIALQHLLELTTIFHRYHLYQYQYHNFVNMQNINSLTFLIYALILIQRFLMPIGCDDNSDAICFSSFVAVRRGDSVAYDCLYWCLRVYCSKTTHFMYHFKCKTSNGLNHFMGC